MGGDESENRYMTMEDGSISMEREQLSQMASRQITYNRSPGKGAYSVSKIKRTEFVVLPAN
jgi:hypothetical protein